MNDQNLFDRINLRLCASCASWQRESAIPSKIGYITAPCAMTGSQGDFPKPVEQKRGSDSCGKWSQIKL